MMACAAPPLESGLVRAMLDYADCQAQQIGSGAYQALAAPGSTLSLLLTGLLTLFVAFFGYRMLLGETPNLREGVLALVKIGIVLALATGWPAYRTLVYDVALQGPAELTAEIGQPAGLPGAGGGLVDRLDMVDKAVVALAMPPMNEARATPAAPQGSVARSISTVTPSPPLGFNGFGLETARVFFLVGAIVPLAAAHLIAGLLLALGPFFIAFLLFEGTRGWFEGWVRVLAGAFLGAVGAAIVLGVELTLIEPWLADLLARRSAGEVVAAPATELLVVMLMFDLLLLVIVAASACVARGFRPSRIWMPAWFGSAVAAAGERSSFSVTQHRAGRDPGEHRSRAARVVDAVAANQRREAALAAPAMGSAEVQRRAPPGKSPGAPAAASAPLLPPLGQSFHRRTRSRVSGMAKRRDRGS